jgi:endonuclease G
VVSIDSVESVTGIDFFPNFQNEDQIEKISCVVQWSWTSSSTIVARQVSNGPAPSLARENNHPSDLKAPASVQCRGMTKAGKRCKNKTRSPGGYCHLHEARGKR